MSVLSYRNQLIHYEAVGRGAPIIFIHSWLGSWRYWWPTMQALSHSFRAFAFDLWGFGNSSRTPDCYSLENYVEMLQALVDGLGVAQPVTLVGHALGAAIAIRYTRRYPGHVARLATVALPLEANDLNWRPIDAHPQGGHPQEPALRHPEGSRGTKGMPLQVGQKYPQLELEFSKADSAAIDRLLQEMSSCDFVDDLKTLRLPRLLIACDDDPFVRPPSATATKSLDGDEDCRLLLLTGAGHFPMLELTATFNRLLIDFMHGLDVAPKAHWQRRTH